MNITEITIENIKGIQNHCFRMTLSPNKPNILVAPNGFGKSSLAIAFESLHESRLMVEDKNFYLENNTLVPKLEIRTSTGLCLHADNNTNEINELFETFVINDQQQPKANVRHFLGKFFSKPTIDIKPTVLVQTVPCKVEFEYKLSYLKTIFGNNGKVLSDIKSVFVNGIVMSKIALIDLATIDKNSKWQKELNSFIEAINREIGTAGNIRDYINCNCGDIMGMGPFPCISEVLYKHGIVANTDIAGAFLYSWQILQVYRNLHSDFKKACKYSKYLQDKEYYIHEIAEINPIKNRFIIKPKESNGQLIVEWPKAYQMSNGQRDILVFYAKLLEFERKNHNMGKIQILLIDEIFDYLDDVNILLFQYKISNLIDKYRKEKGLLFPILLTHLDPNYFHHFCFNEQRINVCYLKEYNAKKSSEIMHIISKRDCPDLKDKLDETYFHFNPKYADYDLEKEFSQHKLNLAWAKPANFRKAIFRILRTYLFESGKPYDPIAVCWSLRLMIEEIVYSLIKNETQKKVFVQTHKTKEKLLYASSIGLYIKDIYFLLGLIYNVSLHDNGLDLTKSTALKLESLVIKNMIKEIAIEHNCIFGDQ